MSIQQEQNERLENELSLLDAMYPDQIIHDQQTREVKYVSSDNTFHLRLPDGYLHNELPEIIDAHCARTDVRRDLKAYIQKSCVVAEEIIDSIILEFNEICLKTMTSTSSSSVEQSNDNLSDSENTLRKATVVVWLHHLLNTNKRKQALSPPSAQVSGLTKPGYPGVLIYSGSAVGVHEHVNELKQLNWQAFQVRLETDEEWAFHHGKGVKEVETMKDVVAEVGEDKKDMFMEAMRMK